MPSPKGDVIFDHRHNADVSEGIAELVLFI
jgi:hypothetical protein